MAFGAPTRTRRMSTQPPTPRSSPEPQRKRARTLAAGSGDDRASDDSFSSTSTLSRSSSAKGMTATNQRKRSYLVTKEEQERLQEELRYLEARVALLRHETGMVAPAVVESKRALGAQLCSAVLQQDLAFASMQSMFSGFTNSRVTSPLETYIHLPTDWQQRRDALLEIRDRKIDFARHFLAERTRFTHPFQEISEQFRHVTAGGEYCTIKLDVVPFEGAKSVRQVFDAMYFHLANLEISMTEMSGKVTVRENHDNTETSVLQYRLVTSDREGVLVEKNAVLFMETSEMGYGNLDDQSVLLAFDFVNQDDLYPYRPSQRLRNDSACAMKLSAHRRKRAPRALCGGLDKSVDEEDELVVTLTRVSFLWLRETEISVPQPILRSIAEDLSGGFDLMVTAMRDDMYQTSASSH